MQPNFCLCSRKGVKTSQQFVTKLLFGITFSVSNVNLYEIFFISNWFSQKNLSELMINSLKCFRFGVEFAEISEFSLNPLILSICTVFLCIFSEYIEFCTASSQHKYSTVYQETVNKLNVLANAASYIWLYLKLWSPRCSYDNDRDHFGAFEAYLGAMELILKSERLILET